MIKITYKDGSTERAKLLSKDPNKETSLKELIMYYTYFNMAKTIRINGIDGRDQYIKTKNISNCELIKE